MVCTFHSPTRKVVRVPESSDSNFGFPEMGFHPLVWLEFPTGPRVSVDSVFLQFNFANRLLFSGVGLLALHPTPNLEDQVPLLVCPLHRNLPGLVGPARG